MYHFIHRRFVGPIAVFVSLLVFTVGCVSDSEDPGAPLGSSGQELNPVTVTAFTDEVELFLEYPRLLPGKDARFLVHLTVLADGAPVRSGELRLEIHSAAGDAFVFTASEPKREGLFIPIAELPTAGTYTASLSVQSDQVNATIPLPPLVVYADFAHAMALDAAEEREELPNLVPFLLEQQWRIGLLLAQVERKTMIERLLVPGEVEASHGAMAVVSAPLAGRLLPVEGKPLPRIGEQVSKGQVLAYLEPPLTTADFVQLSFNEMSQSSLEMEVLVREFDLRTKSLEVEQGLQQSKARVTFAQQALQRIEGLREKGLGTVAELAAAKRDFDVARFEEAGGERLRASLAKTEKSLSHLRKQVDRTVAGSASPGHLRVALIAPIDGEIIQAHHVAGEHVESQGAIYAVLDSQKLWITARVSEFDFARLGKEPGAWLEFAAFPERSFDVLGAMGGHVVSVGRVINPISRTVALRYQVPNPQGLLRVGMFVDVFLETKVAKQAVVIPREAVVLENGLPVAFVLLDGETFQKRNLQLGIRDGDFVEVIAGIAEGERVVTRGAFFVRLALASPASFGEGHAH